MTRISIALAVALAMAHVALADGPLPVGNSSITVQYSTTTGMVNANGFRDYTGSQHHDATVLPGAPNLTAFSSVNDFGRRGQLLFNPQYANVIRPGESLIAHAFFKTEEGHHDAFFPDLSGDGRIHLTTRDTFDRPVQVDPDTFMFHVLWDDMQNQELDQPYLWIDDHYTITPNFRDLDTFLQAGLFSNLPTPNYVQNSADLQYTISGDGTNTIQIELSFPYDLLRNLEEQGQTVPDHLPAPGGFLEPFHFHIEYVVVPEPATLSLLALGAGMLARRPFRRRA
jgi:hypothetical protein